jgi:molybdenum cofactor cytidylyltransferase
VQIKLEKLAIVLLGAGLSTRFGSEKLVSDFEGSLLLQRVLDNLGPSRILPKYLVVKTGFSLDKFDLRGFTPVLNPDYRSGISSSIKAGLRRCDPDTEGIVLTLADMPFVHWKDVERLIAEASSRREIVAFSHRGEKGFPTFLPCSIFPDIFSLEGENGAFSLVRTGKVSSKLIEGEKRHVQDIDIRDDILDYSL